MSGTAKVRIILTSRADSTCSHNQPSERTSLSSGRNLLLAASSSSITTLFLLRNNLGSQIYLCSTWYLEPVEGNKGWGWAKFYLQQRGRTESGPRWILRICGRKWEGGGEEERGWCTEIVLDICCMNIHPQMAEWLNLDRCVAPLAIKPDSGFSGYIFFVQQLVVSNALVVEMVFLRKASEARLSKSDGGSGLT